MSPCFAQVQESPRPRPKHPYAVLTGKAIKLRKPPFPDCNCKFSKINKITVQFIVNKNGVVEFAKAMSGNPMLKAASEKAIRNPKFYVSYVAGNPVNAHGVITYRFELKNNRAKVSILRYELKLDDETINRVINDPFRDVSNNKFWHKSYDTEFASFD